jgi:hypothetical protein
MAHPTTPSDVHVTIWCVLWVRGKLQPAFHLNHGPAYPYACDKKLQRRMRPRSSLVSGSVALKPTGCIRQSSGMMVGVAYRNRTRSTARWVVREGAQGRPAPAARCGSRALGAVTMCEAQWPSHLPDRPVPRARQRAAVGPVYVSSAVGRSRSRPSAPARQVLLLAGGRSSRGGAQLGRCREERHSDQKANQLRGLGEALPLTLTPGPAASIVAPPRHGT